MTASVPPSGELAPLPAGGGELPVETMIERVSAELVLAEDLPCDGAGEESLAELWTDPCHFLRRACQVADYGAASAALGPTENPLAPR